MKNSRRSIYLRSFQIIFLFTFITIGALIFLMHPLTDGFLIGDFMVYWRALSGDTVGFYYPYWFLLLFFPITLIPIPMAISIFWLISIVSLYFAAQVFGGKFPAIIATFQFICMIIVGQVVSILIGGLALLYWSINHQRPYLAGFGLSLAIIKPQTGLPLALAIILLSSVSWKFRLKILVIPLILAIISLIVFPGWPGQILADYASQSPKDGFSISLWKIIGPFALLLWIPVIFIKLPLQKHLLFVAAATALAVPYFQQNDLLILFVMPLGWLPLLGNIGFAVFPFGKSAIMLVSLVPLGIYLFIMKSGLHKSG